MVELTRCGTLQEALLLRSVLEGHGLAAAVPDELSAATLPYAFLGQGGVRLLVEPERLEEARRIVAASAAPAEEPVAVEKAFAYLVRERPGRGPELLVFAHPSRPGWRVPKGSIEPGEAPEAAARRETFEETGLSQLGEAYFLGHYLREVRYADASPGGPQTQRHHFYLFRVPAATPDRWQHLSTGGGYDDGLRFDFFWIPVGGREASGLAAGGSTALPELRRRLETVSG